MTPGPTGALGGGGDDATEGDGEKKEGEAVAAEGGMDPEVLAAIEEAEAKRKDKHRRMEEERETVRQDIRNKVCEVAVESPGGIAGL